MILFEEDWLDPRNSGPEGTGPIIDLQTPNKSFIEYASLLYHGLKIKNWAFCLALHDPKLQGVNPFDENLSEEMKYRVGVELTNNPWYYLRECALVPALSGSEPNKFRAHRANIGMFWLFMNNVSFFLLQPRQTGKSVVADIINNYLIHYRMFNATTILVTLTQNLLSANIERIKAMRDLLPAYTITRTKNDTKAKEAYTYPARNNELVTKVSQMSEVAANAVGRGLSTPIQQYDEAAFIAYMDVVFPAAAAATSAAIDEARRKGEPYGTILTTTAGDKTSRSGKFMYRIYENSADWTEHYYDLENKEKLHEVVRKNSKDGTLMVGATFNHLQLGFTDDWLREKIRLTQTDDKDKINRDFFNVWTSGSNLSPLPPDITEKIMQSEKDPAYMMITKSGYIVKWYIPEEEIGEYMRKNHCIIGADTSEAVNRDSTSFVVINVSTLETVATMSVAEADTIKLADFIYDFMVSFPKTTLIVERKSSWMVFVETLYLKLPLAGFDPFKRLYNVVIQDKDKHVDIYQNVANPRFRRNSQFYTANKNKFGFFQTGNTRDLLYREVLQLAGKRCRNIIYDRTLSNELRGLEVNAKTGRIDHTVDGHDDNVMAWLLAQWFLMYGKNLSWYGIEAHLVMMRATDTGDVLDDSKARERKLVEQYQKELLDLTEKLVVNEHTQYKLVIEHQIRQLNNKLNFFGVETKNVDTLLLEVKQQRLEKVREKMASRM